MKYPKPFGQRILVRPLETDTGAFTLADNAKEPPQKGEVVAVGVVPLVDDKPTIKVGDIVHYSRFAKDEVDCDGEKLIYLRIADTEIFGIL